jgi:hypothetical protein
MFGWLKNAENRERWGRAGMRGLKIKDESLLGSLGDEGFFLVLIPNLLKFRSSQFKALTSLEFSNPKLSIQSFHKFIVLNSKHLVLNFNKFRSLNSLTIIISKFHKFRKFQFKVFSTSELSNPKLSIPSFQTFTSSSFQTQITHSSLLQPICILLHSFPNLSLTNQ